jgi:RimJ/RimL family protein N-acetyltransferase
MTPILHSARLTLGPATMAHFEAYAAFTATEDSRFPGGPGSRRDAWEAVCTHAGQWTLRGCGTFWLTDRATDAPALMSLIDPANVASIAVAECLGASLEGRHRHDDGHEVGRWRHLPGGIQ